MKKIQAILTFQRGSDGKAPKKRFFKKSVFPPCFVFHLFKNAVVKLSNIQIYFKLSGYKTLACGEHVANSLVQIEWVRG